MDRNKQIGPLLVRDRRPRFQRDECVVLPRIDDLGPQPRLQQFAQLAPDFEHQVFFFQAIRPDGSRIVAAMPGIDHNLADLQSQRADQRTIAARGWSGLTRIQI